MQCHHSDHAIGLDFHEGPFIDKGDETVIEAGMCFTIEPGIYAPGFGGFRHSDTVVIRSIIRTPPVPILGEITQPAPPRIWRSGPSRHRALAGASRDPA